ncbi:MAG TPA: Holliday junction branch migration protein RuvA [Chitinophagaceae bacterium]|jgi:Holliday junction DNA helicase RuvA|nr:Holliday junction branch migration protein RuvA [Chitinophagaceae bacterium]
MIAYIDGKLTYKSPALVYLDVNGLGYEVQISLNTYSRIQHLERCKLLTYLHIKEDAHTLYGFFEDSERVLFLQLISVSGVGASTARIILSSMKPDEVRSAIIGEDERLLESIKGIGAKTAKRIILELKDKMVKYAGAQPLTSTEGNTLQVDALNALLALGIARPAAENAVRKVMRAFPAEGSLEMLIKDALKNL